jgi:hypothetical protein
MALGARVWRVSDPKRAPTKTESTTTIAITAARVPVIAGSVAIVDFHPCRENESLTSVQERRAADRAPLLHP